MFSPLHWVESPVPTLKYAHPLSLTPQFQHRLCCTPQKRQNLQQTRSLGNVKSSAAASTSRNKLPGLSKAASLPKDSKPVIKSEPKDVKLEVKEEPAKPKPSGKLDFSKAKPAAPKPAPGTRKAEPAESSSVAQAALKQELKPSKSKDKAGLFLLPCLTLLTRPVSRHPSKGSLR